MRVYVAIVLGLAAAYSCCYAQPIEPGAVPFHAQGTVTSSVTVHTAPPYGPLNALVGKEIRTLKSGETVSILERKRYAGFAGPHVWYRIEPIGESSASWWVYGGEEDKNTPIQVIRPTR